VLGKNRQKYDFK